MKTKKADRNILLYFWKIVLGEENLMRMFEVANSKGDQGDIYTSAPIVSTVQSISTVQSSGTVESLEASPRGHHSTLVFKTSVLDVGNGIVQ